MYAGALGWWVRPTLVVDSLPLRHTPICDKIPFLSPFAVCILYTCICICHMGRFPFFDSRAFLPSRLALLFSPLLGFVLLTHFTTSLPLMRRTHPFCVTWFAFAFSRSFTYLVIRPSSVCVALFSLPPLLLTAVFFCFCFYF